MVLAQDRANISADFLEMMKQEIIEVIKKYVDIDEEAIDVKMTNKPGEDGTVGAPALYANIPIVTIKNEARKLEGTINKTVQKEKNDKAENIEASNENKIDDDNKESEEEDTAELNTDENEIQEEKISESEDKKENLEEEANEEKNT